MVNIDSKNIVVENNVLIKATPNSKGIVEIPNGVTEIPDNFFRNCGNLVKIVLPNSVKKIGESAFLNCENLKEVKIPQKVKTIGKFAFANCRNLKTVLLPPELEAIEDYTFQNCLNLKSIKLPDNLKAISTAAFMYNCSLQTVKIPENVNFINDYAFYACPALETIKAKAKTIMLSQNAFKDCLNLDKNKPHYLKPQEEIEVPENTYDFFMNDKKVELRDIKKIVKSFVTKISPESEININFNGNNLDKNSVKTLKETIKLFVKHDFFPTVTINKVETKELNDKTLYLYSKEEVAVLEDINKFLQDETTEENELYYQEAKYYNRNIQKWQHSKVIKANKKLDSIVDKIKKLIPPLTPFEVMIYIHNFVTNFKYSDNVENSDEDPRTGINALCSLSDNTKDPSIVCVGYATLVKAIIDKLNIKGLTCKLNSCKLSRLTQVDVKADSANGEISRQVNKITTDGHLNNIIIIKDPKYNLNGAYIEDACWDSKNKKPKSGRPEKNEIGKLGFCHCLLPIGDVKHLKNYTYNSGKALTLNEAYTYYETEYETKDAIYEVDENYVIKRSEKQPAVYKKYRMLIGNPIPKSSYKDAIIAMCEANKIGKELATEYADCMIDRSTNISNSSYSNFADNCFKEKDVDFLEHKNETLHYVYITNRIIESLLKRKSFNYNEITKLVTAYNKEKDKLSSLQKKHFLSKFEQLKLKYKEFSKNIENKR